MSLNRLPTLHEVLSLKTQAPVDLWGFYVFLRQEYRGIEYLDFYLAVVKHVSLCKAYIQSQVHTSSLSEEEELWEAEGDVHRMSTYLRATHDPALVQEKDYTMGDPNAPSVEKSFVTRNDIKQHVHNILVTYFIPAAEREIILPTRITTKIRHAIEIEGRYDPEVFLEAREYVFEALQNEAFRSFLGARALANLSSLGSILRLSIGLVAMFGGFWLAFTFILLDWSPKAHRAWVVLPFTVGVYGLVSGVYNLDPLLALIGYSEVSGNGLVKVKEPYVRRLLLRRSMFVGLVMAVLIAALCVLFILVPGKRL